MRILLLGLLLAALLPADAQSPVTSTVRKWRQQQESAIIHDFTNFLSIPNIASDSLHILQNAEWIRTTMLAGKIANVQLLMGAQNIQPQESEAHSIQPQSSVEHFSQSQSSGGHSGLSQESGVPSGYPPAVYGEIRIPGATRTIGFYAHYDGQPVNPAQWAKGLEPFKPILYDASLLKGGHPIEFPTAAPYQPEWRIYARGASDDKAGVMAILTAWKALSAAGIPPTANIKFLFEGEEEAGSTHLGDIFQTHADLLKADCWVICDGPVHQTGRKQIVFGVRGDAHLDLTVYGPKRPLHSGHYGNWAPNPAMMLTRLLASMKDDSGHVTIKGFYDDVQPLTPTESAALASVPSVDQQMKDELGIAATEIPGKNLSESINLPSLNINGFHSGNVGAQASNQIPTYATAVLDLRLVLGNDAQRQQQKVIDHIRAQGYTVLDHDPTDAERHQYRKIIKVLANEAGYNAQRTAMDLPVIQIIRKALQATSSDELVLQPTSGGSLPLYLFEKYLHTHTVTVPLANHDNNQHAENENLRLQNFWNGIESMAAIMTAGLK